MKKRPTGCNSHLSIKNCSLTCQKGSTTHPFSKVNLFTMAISLLHINTCQQIDRTNFLINPDNQKTHGTEIVVQNDQNFQIIHKRKKKLYCTKVYNNSTTTQYMYYRRIIMYIPPSSGQTWIMMARLFHLELHHLSIGEGRCTFEVFPAHL